MHHLWALGSLSRLRSRKPIFCDIFFSGVDIVELNFYVEKKKQLNRI